MDLEEQVVETEGNNIKKLRQFLNEGLASVLPGMTMSLLFAMQCGKAEITELLLNNGVSPKKMRTSPLYFAVVNNNKNISHLLLIYGAKPETLRNQLSTLLDCAATMKHKEVEKILGKVDRLGEFLHEQDINITDLFAIEMKKASINVNNKITREMCDIVSKITLPSELESVNIEKANVEERCKIM